jgi:hypothetical protein
LRTVSDDAGACDSGRSMMSGVAKELGAKLPKTCEGP